jgi:hypothetical protein
VGAPRLHDPPPTLREPWNRVTPLRFQPALAEKLRLLVVAALQIGVNWRQDLFAPANLLLFAAI